VSVAGRPWCRPYSSELSRSRPGIPALCVFAIVVTSWYAGLTAAISALVLSAIGVRLLFSRNLGSAMSLGQTFRIMPCSSCSLLLSSWFSLRRRVEQDLCNHVRKPSEGVPDSYRNRQICLTSLTTLDPGSRHGGRDYYWNCGAQEGCMAGSRKHLKAHE